MSLSLLVLLHGVDLLLSLFYQLPPPSSSCWSHSRTTTGAFPLAWRETRSPSCSGTTKTSPSRNTTTSTPRSTSPWTMWTTAAYSWSTLHTFTTACTGWWPRMSTAGMRRLSRPCSSTHQKQVTMVFLSCNKTMNGQKTYSYSRLFSYFQQTTLRSFTVSNNFYI